MKGLHFGSGIALLFMGTIGFWASQGAMANSPVDDNVSATLVGSSESVKSVGGAGCGALEAGKSDGAKCDAVASWKVTTTPGGNNGTPSGQNDCSNGCGGMGGCGYYFDGYDPE